MELNQTRIEDAIVREVADKMIREDDLYSRAKNAIEARVDSLFKEVVDAKIQSEIELAIKNGFEREYCRVDAFGQRRGEPTNIRAELERLIAGYWNETVDRNGKPSSSYGNKLTRAEWMMTHLVASDFQGAMKQHVVNIGGALKDKLRAELHGTVNRLLSDVFYVKSVEDQGSKRSDRSIIDPEAKPLT